MITTLGPARITESQGWRQAPAQDKTHQSIFEKRPSRLFKDLNKEFTFCGSLFHWVTTCEVRKFFPTSILRGLHMILTQLGSGLDLWDKRENLLFLLCAKPWEVKTAIISPHGCLFCRRDIDFLPDLALILFLPKRRMCSISVMLASRGKSAIV